MLHLGLRVSDLEQSLAFYSARGYAELGSVPQTEFGSLTMLQLPDDPFVSLELVHHPERPVEDVGAVNHLVVQVDDLDATSQTSGQRALQLRRRLSRDRESGPHG